MRILERNKKEIWYANRLSESCVVDGNGLKTGSDARRTLSKLNESWQKEPDANDFADPATGSAGEVPTISASAASGRPAYIVGVTSWGPDGAPGTWDDITTLPEEVVK